MNHCLRIFVFSFSFFFLSNIQAQVGFSMPITSNAQPGSVLDIPVKVSNFDSIVTAQFVIKWDPAVLEFQAVDQLNLPDLTELEFGTLEALSSGILRFAWEYYIAQGTTLPDGTAIFHLKLKVIGALNSGTALAITELPPLTFFEVVNAQNVAWSLSQSPVTMGFVAVGYTYVSAQNPFANASFSVGPNPFSEKTTLSFDLASAADLRVTLTDTAGRPVFESSGHFPAGRNGMEIAYPIVDRQGIYFLIIQSSGFSHAETLVFSK